jgi:DNA repair protein RadC
MIADHLLLEFGSLRGIIGAQRGHLRRVLPDYEAVVEYLATLNIVIGDYLRSDLRLPVAGLDDQQVRDFLRHRLCAEPVEVAYGLYFNRLGHLIHDGELARGSYDRCPLHAKEVARVALNVGASVVIIAHNHPSGDATPSNSDKTLTREVEAVCRVVDAKLYDHIIVGNPGLTSFRDERWL